MKRISKIAAVFFLTVLSVSGIFSEEIPNGYGNIKLGMGLEETKEALKKNGEFGYHGDRDVSLLPGENRVLIETDAEKGFGGNFLTRCWFQFYKEKLYIITINVNKEKMDYYSIFTTLCKKYGEPVMLNPSKAVWKSDEITMSLEKPLSLKYVDNKVFEELQNKSTVPEGPTQMTREMFLEGL
ncbi:MAG: hypothetical protein HUK25_02240 [Treponema sp.]|nr:hypothetical protein [Treponema sp.]